MHVVACRSSYFDCTKHAPTYHALLSRTLWLMDIETHVSGIWTILNVGDFPDSIFFSKKIKYGDEFWMLKFDFEYIYFDNKPSSSLIHLFFKQVEDHFLFREEKSYFHFIDINPDLLRKMNSLYKEKKNFERFVNPKTKLFAKTIWPYIVVAHLQVGRLI